MLELDDEEARGVGRDPLLVVVVGLLLLDAVVAGEVEAVGVVGLEVGVGRGFAEVIEAGGEVVVEDHQRDSAHRGGCRSPRAPGRWRRGTSGVPQNFVSSADWMRMWRMYLVSGSGLMGGMTSSSETVMAGEPGPMWILRGLRYEVAGGEVPVLAFAAVGGELDGFAVGAVEGLVDVEDGLDGVVAGRDVAELADGVAAGCVGDGDGGAGLPGVDGDAEDHLRLGRVVDLHARLVAGVVREQQEQAAVERLSGARGGEADGDGLGRKRDERGGEDEREQAHGGSICCETPGCASNVLCGERRGYGRSDAWCGFLTGCCTSNCGSCHMPNWRLCWRRCSLWRGCSFGSSRDEPSVLKA